MVVSYQVVYWRDIPAQVKVKAGRERGGAALESRFQEAIDAAAMRAGLTGTDAYLGEWRTGEAKEREGEVDAVARAVAAELEAAYPDERLAALAENGGRG
jgi:hypothetical protein